MASYALVSELIIYSGRFAKLDSRSPVSRLMCSIGRISRPRLAIKTKNFVLPIL